MAEKECKKYIELNEYASRINTYVKCRYADKETLEWAKDECIRQAHCMPAADVVEVVRCKDCRYCFEQTCHEPRNRILFHVPDFGNHYHYAGRIRVPENHFCGFGERKEPKNE